VSADGSGVAGGELARDAGLEPAEHDENRERPPVLIDPLLGGRAERARRHGHVDVVFLRVVRHVRQHADDGVRTIVHLKHLADDVRIAAELRAPVRVAEDQHRVGSRRIVAGDERASEHGPDAEDVEEIVRHDADIDAVGLAALEQIEIHLMIFDQRVERRRPLAIVVEFFDRDARVGPSRERRRLAQHDEPVAIGVWQRLQQHAVDHAEDGRVRADAEAERHDGDGGEAAVLD
jgi:hypothetical protein